MQSGTLDQPVAYIYALIDPRETDDVNSIRYIGKTNDPNKRIGRHLACARNGSRTHCHNWIRQLLAVGLTPTVSILETTTRVAATYREREWIAHLRTAGCPLTNLTDGGEGGLGCRHSPETRAKIGAAHLGKKLSPEHRIKLSASHVGNKNCLGHRHPISDETRAKLSIVGMGKRNALGCRRSKETRARISAANVGNRNALGHRLSNELKLKIAASGMGNRNALGHHPSDEAKLKMTAASRAYWGTRTATLPL
jgi:hypothetical protein